MMYGGWMWHGWGWGGWVLMSLAMVAFWALVITAIVVTVRYLAGTDGRRNAPTLEPRTAEDLLAERFARGEIDDEEYRRRLTVLREHR